MKKLSIAAALLSLSIAAPAFACPESHGETPRTAEKTKDADQATAAKTTEKAKAAKPAEKVKDAKPAKPEKVSQR